jgi:predicted HAD superfamily phosphohydrolase
MLEPAGLGIAFNGKECVKERADISIDSQDLTEVIPYILEFEARFEGDRKLNLNLVA